MEASAFFAVARFRKIKFAQVLYAGDCVAGEKWDGRFWFDRTSAKARLLSIAIEAVKSL
jgi:hypothetical protein